MFPLKECYARSYTECTPSVGLSRSDEPYTRHRKSSTRSTQQPQLSVGTWATASALREHLFSRLCIDLVSNTFTAMQDSWLGCIDKATAISACRRMNCLRVFSLGKVYLILPRRIGRQFLLARRTHLACSSLSPRLLNTWNCFLDSLLPHGR